MRYTMIGIQNQTLNGSLKSIIPLYPLASSPSKTLRIYRALCRQDTV